MNAAMVNADPIADALEQTEHRLLRWGEACRGGTAALGLPTISSIQTMIAHVRRQERLARDVRRKALRAKYRDHRANKPGAHMDSKQVAEAQGFFEPDPTALGKHTLSTSLPKIVFDSETALLDETIARLPNWMRVPIIRSYLYGQPDRKAAQDLQIRKSLYRQRREAAIEALAEALAMRDGKL